MSITYTNNRAIFRDQVGSEEAAGLLQWLLRRPDAEADFFDCVEVHTDNLIALTVGRGLIVKWPEDAALAARIKLALTGSEETHAGR